MLIGEQCRFVENLRSENYENGEAIPSNLTDSEWETAISGATAVCTESAFYLETYGRLYNWYALDDDRGLCPSGWHVPSDGEWTVMTDYLGGELIAGAQMKSSTGWPAGNNGTNSSGFSGLPGGIRYYFFGTCSYGNSGVWWSSSNDGYGYGISRYLGSNDYVQRDFSLQQQGSSIRCVRDAE